MQILDPLTMTVLGIRDEIERMFTDVGWRSFATIRCPTFVQLVRESYATFEFDLPMRYTVIALNVIRFH